MPFGAYVDAVREAFACMRRDARFCAAVAYSGRGRRFSREGRKPAARRGYAAIKTNANFPNNRTHGLPTIQGAILLSMPQRVPLALLDSIEITIKRHGAATAVAARYLARPDSHVATICGLRRAGAHSAGRVRHRLDIRHVFVFDFRLLRAAAFAAENRPRARHQARHQGRRRGNLARRDALGDVIATCTPARTPYLGPDDVRPDIHRGDRRGQSRQERNPSALMARAKVVADVTAQCAIWAISSRHRGGDDAGSRCPCGAWRIVAGSRPGRAQADETRFFGRLRRRHPRRCASARAYELARETGAGQRLSLA